MAEEEEERYTTNTTVQIAETSVQLTVTDSGSVVEEWVRSQRGKPMVGLDIEWRPNFGKGDDNPAALLQLCVENNCLILQMLYLDFVPEILREFLRNPAVKLVGVGVKKDTEKLREDYGLECEGEVELGSLAAEKLGRPELKKGGLKNLAMDILGFRVSKPKQISLSNWETKYLQRAQMEYACMDAFLSFAIAAALPSDRYTTRTTVQLADAFIQLTLTDSGGVVEEWVSSQRGKTMVGFGIEWLRSSGKGEDNRTALLQLCVENNCLIIQMLYLDFVPEILVEFLRDPAVKLVGIGVKNGIAKLRDDYGLECASEVEVGRLAAEKLGREELKKADLENLAMVVLGIEVSKPKEVGLSDWAARSLQPEQVEYACIDAFLLFSIGATVNVKVTNTNTPTTTVINNNGGVANENHKKNRIQVSNTKKPLFFYVNLAKRYLQQHDEVELSALGMAIATVVTVAEILKNNGLAIEKRILTSTIDMKDETRERPIQKAKVEIILAKADMFDELMAAASEKRDVGGEKDDCQ